MQRREFVRVMAAACVLPEALIAQEPQNGKPVLPPPPAPVPWTLGLNSKTPLPKTELEDNVATTDASFFSPVQMATLVHLSAILLPPLNDRPGALDAQAPQFLDFLIGDSPAPRQQLYTGGLDWLESQSQQKHGVAFAKTSPDQADVLIKPWLRVWATDHPPTAPHADFINIAHADIRTATMDSEAWNLAINHGPPPAAAMQLYWSPIEPDLSEANFQAVHLRPAPNRDAPKSSNTTRSFPH